MKIGFILNPVAGMGGKVALKGTDGPEILKQAVQQGAVPVSPGRALSALNRLVSVKNKFKIYTAKGCMGEFVLAKTRLDYELLDRHLPGQNTSAEDTKKIVKELNSKEIDLLLFAGGDGTAKDILDALNEIAQARSNFSDVITDIPVLGIPCGVKMHSALFGINPERTGDLACSFIKKAPLRISPAPVMDIDEHAARLGIVQADLAGYLLTPFKKDFCQGSKMGSLPDEFSTQQNIAKEIISLMDQDEQYIIGPGTTMKCITDRLNIKGTLLGFDLVCNKELVKNDLNEKDILKAIKTKKTNIILTIIGGQGYILGRGNQQVSPDVLRRIKKENIIVCATMDKLASFEGEPLLIDTGDNQTDAMMQGYIKIITGQNEKTVMPVM